MFAPDSRQPFILDVYSRHEPNSPAQTEKLIQAAKNTEGMLIVCRVNAERFPSILESVGATVEHLPIAVFILGGRPIKRFLGNGDIIDSSTLDKCVSDLLKAAGLSSTRSFLKSAEKALDDGDIPAAVEIYKEILHNKQLKAEAVALSGLAMCELHTKNPQGCKELLDVITTSFKDELDNPYVKRAFVSYDLHQSTGTNSEAELKEKLAQNPKDLETKYALAVLYSTTNRSELAIEEALGIIKIDKQFNGQAARKFVLQISTFHFVMYMLI